MSILLGIMGTICLGYYGACVRYAGVRVSLLWIWLAAGIAFWGMAIGRKLDFWKKAAVGIPKEFWLAAGVVMALAVAVLLVLVALVLSAMGKRGKMGLDVLVVLGCQVKGRSPSRALLGRLQEAEKYLKENPETLAVLSGGQGYGEEITEAECMGKWLEHHGISGTRLIWEEHSTSTLENLVFSMKILKSREEKKEWRVGIVTNHFHMYRSLKIARKKGYGDVCGIAAPGGSVLVPHYVLREAVAVLKEIICGNI